MNVSVDLAPDEHRLIEVVREIKRSGFGEFHGTVTHREITLVKEIYTHKLS